MSDLPATPPDAPPEGQPMIRTIAMPADTNPAGDIFGGWLLSQMDMAGASAAQRRARGRCATVSIEGMSFHSPVHVGDEVSLYATIIHEGRSSLRVRVEAWRRARESEATNRVTQGVFTFVALDESGRSRPLP